MTTDETLGTIAALWRYPVGSLQGESLAALDIAATGVVGDRAWAVTRADDDEAGVAARGRQWHPLVRAAARFLAPPRTGAPTPEVEIALPDGATIHGDAADVDARLTAHMGHPVRLRLSETAPREHRTGSEDRARRPYRAAPLHLITTASLARLGDLHPEGVVDARRFRPNLVIDSGAAIGFIENDWIGRRLAIGPLTVAISEPCARCALTTLPQAELPHDRQILRAVNGHNGGHFGVYATVIDPGTAHLGDAVGFLA